MFAVAATRALYPGRTDVFQPQLHDNPQASQSCEPGCHQFGSTLARDRPDGALFCELHTDRGEFEMHLSAPHFTAFRDAVAAMVAAPAVRTCRRVIA